MSNSTEAASEEHACAAAHFVRFYQDDVVLLAEVAEFLDRGLRGGSAAIVIATAEHRAALRQQLAGLGSVADRPGWFPGELIMLDAAGALARFMVDDWPDAARFDTAIGDVVRKAGSSGMPVHAFGEMVALLCEQGLYDAAVRLEELWNDLRSDCDFSLFCAYPWHLFPSDELAADFRRICHTHDHVCRPGHDGPDAGHDLHLQLAVLEQKNRALHNELRRARESELTLRHREREFADFVENAAEGLHRVGPDGTILWANKAELALLGYRWEEYVGHHIADFHADADVIGSIIGRLQEGDTLYDVPARLRCKDGSIKHVVINSNGCFDNGRLRYTRCFTRDATERYQLEQAHRERAALVAELSRSNRAKDEFLAMLAHELRNPLAPISAAAHLLSVADGDRDRVRHSATVIRRQVGHMKGLIDDLLDVARVTRGLIVLNKEALDLREAVQEAVEQVAPQVEARRHRLQLDLPAEPSLVNGDRKRLIQVAANILTNAAKFTPEGGRIEVSLRTVGEEAELKVSDNGIGMDPELIVRAFELFSQGHRAPDRTQGGLGIGLALSKSLVESHEGRIGAHSDGPGRGSAFTIRLPRLAGQAGLSLPPAAGFRQDAGAPLRVMVVDDNRDAADALAALLSAVGHQAQALYTSHAALDAASADCPQVFLLDLGLPDIDGIALANRLQALPQGAGLVLVAVTGYGQAADRARTTAAGFHHHLVKPVDANELLALLAGLPR